MFYPESAPVPEALLNEEFLVRPLRATDVALDYDAVITSRAELFLWSEGKWPREGFTLEENLADLVRHEREHRERNAFTYTVMNPSETECLGCLYIYSLERLLRQAGSGSVEQMPPANAYATFWVRQSRLADNLDRRLLQALLTWFQGDWPFSPVAFSVAPAQARQIRLFEEMGMLLQYTLPKSLLYFPAQESVTPEHWRALL